MAFQIKSFAWTGAFVGGQPYATRKQDFVFPANSSPATIGVYVETEESPIGFTGLGLIPDAISWTPKVDFGPPSGGIEVSLQPGMIVEDLGVSFNIDLVAYFLYPPPPPAPPYMVLDTCSVVFAPVCRTCPQIPGSGSGSCAAGGMTLSSPDETGNAVVMFDFGSTPDPLGMGAGLTYMTGSAQWGFTALPGDLLLSNLGQTSESPPRDCWRARVPAADGSVREYCNDASTGEFVPCGPYGTQFASTDDGWVETLGDTRVYYDVYGVLSRVERGGSVHSYSRDPNGAWVDIESNTATPGRFRYNLQSGQVQSIHEYAQLDGSNWTETRYLSVAQSGGRIAQLTSYPEGRTTSFSYNGDGSLASYEDCSGRTWSLQYEED